MEIKTDVVIVGTGVGGAFSALNLPEDKQIVMITKSDLENPNEVPAPVCAAALVEKPVSRSDGS